MKLSFYGAAEMVTGSCYLLETDKHKILIDCGMFQGDADSEDLNRNMFDFEPAKIDFLLLTHAHIDHSGRIPLLAKRGFSGEILATKATRELCAIMLPDSGYIQEMETEWTNRKRLRAGRPLVEPLYTAADAEDSLKYFRAINYDETIEITEEIKIRYKDAGHILGSAIIELWVKEKGETVKLVFSGDLGNKDMPIMKNPSLIDEADYLIMETTYGNKTHDNAKNNILFLLDIIINTIENGGNIVIPSFAVGRTQEILYMLNMMKESEFSKIKSIPVYVDSPLAINATNVFLNNQDLFDDETKSLIKMGDNPFEFPNLVFTKTAEESKAINFHEGSSIIVSASGMCDAGRIKHHLKHNLWRGNSSVVFVGYQAKGTLGRKILEGQKKVKIFGEDIYVNCKIYNLNGLSGHADKNGLIDWFSSFTKKPAKIFLTHGEEDSLKEFSQILQDKFDSKAEIVHMGETIEIESSIDSIVNIPEKYYAKDNRSEMLLDDIKTMMYALKEAAIGDEKLADRSKTIILTKKIENILSGLEDIDKVMKS
ncbi:MBL fold metallo-hydrolase RNA specificity domain-containing protein [Lutispora saccharofermentans]|uniref:MBL fold metallo-hydrolase n=1 Tax=Lutispora saccharofermentans TaxID=3024236 RepID=A0ABT1NF27_9FIRM|nr:MBL fold metallo-hydrolase [Lutispora saccharofermentans]MCQ1529875.1 MBL fold metallo-hydrolase [Lutispora saccharofermentans]